MIIEVVKVEPVQTVTGKNGKPYQVVEVAYKNQDGKIQGKKLFDFGGPEVFRAVTGANSGDKLDIAVEKDKTGQYWNWVGAKPASGSSSVGSVQSAGSGEVGNRGSTGRVTGSNYETPKEREWRQKRIIRQSAINASISYHELLKAKPSLDEVVDVAKKIESFVNEKPTISLDQALKNIEDMESDIPM